MSDKYTALDTKLLLTIDKIRSEQDSCTLGQLASRCRMSKDAVRHRCQVLKGEGRVTWTPFVAGSLRTVTDPGQRLYDLIVQSAVEHVAAGDRLTADPAVIEWANDVIAQAKAAAWPESELDSVAPEPDGGQTPATSSPEPETKSARENYCEPCERQFKNLGGITGHRTSKAHLARVEELGRTAGAA